MKKAFLLIFVAVEFMGAHAAMGAVSIKKAASVAPAETTSASATTASLVPTVLSLVSGIQQLNAAQKELTAECIPTSQEITFVDTTVKEWAKTGAMTAKEIEKKLDRKPCAGGTGYEAAVRIAAGTEGSNICFDNYVGDSNKDMVWFQYPKVGSATYCSDGSMTCSDKNKKHASDIYDIFNLVDFTEADYTKSEATMAAKLIAKIETCSNAKLSAKKKAMWGEFLTNTISGVGQSTNTGAIMQSVQGITSGGGLSSLGAIASQFMDN